MTGLACAGSAAALTAAAVSVLLDAKLPALIAIALGLAAALSIRALRLRRTALELAANAVQRIAPAATFAPGPSGDRELLRQASMLRQAHRIAKLCYWQWRASGSRHAEESDGSYVYSEGTEELFGHSAEVLAEAGGNYWDMVVHPDDRTAARIRFLQFLRDAAPVHVQEYRILHPKLGERFIRECAEKTLGASGAVAALAGTLQDVTDARQAQQALGESEAKLQRGFRMAKLGHWSFEPNRPRPEGGVGVYTYSDQVQEIYGLTGEAIDAAGDEFYDRFIHPDDREALRALNEEFLTDQRPAYTHEYRILRADGVIGYIRESAEKIRDETGRVIQLVGTIQDVTDQRLADIALRESEAKLKQGYRIAKMGHWSLDASMVHNGGSGTPYIWSEEAAEIFGVSPGALKRSDTRFYELYVHVDDREDLRKLDREFLTSELSGYTQEYRVIRPDGSIRHVLESAEKRFDNTGRITQVNGIVQDVTGLRRSALAMRRVERQLRRAYRLAKLGYWYWEASDRQEETEAVTQLSDEVCEIFGTQRGELDWDDVEDFCSHLVHPDDREMVAKVFRDFDAGTIDNYTITYRALHSSGEVRHVRSVSERIRDEHGKPLYGIGIIQDLTEVKAADASLRRSEYQLRRAQRVAKLYCWHTEEDMQSQRRVVFDHEFYTEILQQVPELPIVSLPNFVERFVHPDDRTRLMPIANAFTHEEIDSYSMEYRLLRPDGTQLYIRSAGERMRDAEGHTIQLFGALQNVTDLKQREQELIEAKNEAELANRSKSEFLANMSHELRTPLNAIIGFSQVIRDQRFGPDQARYVDYARDIFESGHMLLELINDILDVSKLEAQKYVLYEEELSLASVAEVCVNIMKTRAVDGNVRLSAHGLETLPRVWAEERALKQVLLNLLSNAVKFTPRNGSVRIEGGLKADGEVAVSVSDTGIGIPSDVLPHLFAPFRQGDNSISRRFGGSGLGLAISRRLIELHGGRIEVSSDVGKGTTVTVTLPAERVIAAAEPSSTRIAI